MLMAASHRAFGGTLLTFGRVDVSLLQSLCVSFRVRGAGGLASEHLAVAVLILDNMYVCIVSIDRSGVALSEQSSAIIIDS